MSSFHLVFADGPTPKDPSLARALGWEECKLGYLLESGEPFRVYVHGTSVPELVAYVRTLGRDCTFTSFAERQALLMVT